MIPNSEIIQNVLSENKNNGKIINFYPSLDNHVVPNKDLILEGAKNIEMKVVGHTRILEDEELLNEIIKEIK